MKKKKMFFWFALLGVVTAVLILTIISLIMGNVNKHFEVSVYYKIPSLNTLEEVKINISNLDDENKIIEEMLEQVKTVPKNSEFVSAVNEDVGFLDFDYDKENKAVKINLSPSYYNISNIDALFTRAAVVWSITSLNFADKVEFMVNDEPLLDSEGKIFGYMDRNNTVISSNIQPYNTEKRTVVLYFPEKKGLGLIAETRYIEMKQNIALEYQIVEQLIEGPKNDLCTAAIPKDTKIRNIETKEGTCYVDLSAEFVPSGNYDTNETFTIYSIVNSLTELSYIRKVQFLIEGKKTDTLDEVSDFSKTYERDEKCIVIFDDTVKNTIADKEENINGKSEKRP